MSLYQTKGFRRLSRAGAYERGFEDGIDYAAQKHQNDAIEAKWEAEREFQVMRTANAKTMRTMHEEIVHLRDVLAGVKKRRR